MYKEILKDGADKAVANIDLDSVAKEIHVPRPILKVALTFLVDKVSRLDEKEAEALVTSFFDLVDRFRAAIEKAKEPEPDANCTCPALCFLHPDPINE